MRVLCAGLGLVVAGSLGVVVLPVAAENEGLCRGNGLLGDAQRVGTHIGDETHRALARDVNALVELLGDGHGAARRHIELARGLLLQGRGRKRQRRGALLVRALDIRHGKGLVADVGNDAVHLLAGGRLDLFAVFSIIMRLKGLVRDFVREVDVERPVFLRLKGLNLFLAVVHHAHGDRLHAARRETAAHLFPQKRAELITHDAVEHTACLLRVDQVLIDGARLLNALGDDLFRDLVEGHALGLFIVQFQKRLQVPRDRLSLAVRVRCEIDGVAVLGGLLELADELLLAANGLIDGLEIVLDVHTELTFGKVAQVAHTGLDLVLPAQIFSDGFRLGRRLDDHQMLFCHEYYSSSSVTVKEKCLPPLCST